MAEPIPKHLATLVAGTRQLSTASPAEVWGYQQVMATRLSAVTAHFLSQNTSNFVGAGQARQMLLQTKDLLPRTFHQLKPLSLLLWYYFSVVQKPLSSCTTEK